MFGWLKKKKKPEDPIPSKYFVGQNVGYVGIGLISTPGVIHRIYKGPTGEVLYDVQIGGECPYIKRGVKEEEIKG